jgi:amino acid transporter
LVLHVPSWIVICYRVIVVVDGQSGNSTEDTDLERSLGLLAATTIGVGTMIGAGIFVFPGIAAGRAGLAATVSYALGAVIALLVALPASELATAMPESGGGYYFVSRALGSFFGTVIGIGQWLGLMFATAFYLMGFSFYFLEIVKTLGFRIGNPVTVLSLGLCALLTGVNLVGTKSSGDFQNSVVIVLLGILAVFIGYGLVSVFGLSASVAPPEEFAPHGYLPILTTSALVFTSYLGFAQIATVAGEITQPERNLPLAMVGSVLVVGLMYVLAVLVCNSVFGSSKLAELGETALIEVGNYFFGIIGKITLMLGGLLATISSANASIMSSSRALYALSKDYVVPEETSRVSRRFGTPYISLLLSGSIIAVLLILGGLETLAEVASFLHLIMYGSMCVSLLLLRKKTPEWYEPDFELPGYFLIALLGGLASFAIIGFMNKITIVSGITLMLLSVVWHYLYVTRNEVTE